MADVDAVFENGVFRPTTPVSLPEGTLVHLQAVIVPPTATCAAAPEEPDDALKQIYAVLCEVRSSGHIDTAARHNDHTV